MLGVPMPMMTDSGGFQVFSLGAAREQGVGKVLRQPVRRENAVNNVRITEEGARFSVDGQERFISPETSITTQEALGADIIFAFDECTSPLHPLPYTKQSMERTHRWAQRCLDAHTKKNQMLYGIVQGGRFKRLRAQSAKTIGAMPFDGFGIGGSFGKDEMKATLASVIPHLPDEKPRHLLGIGAVADIFEAVEAGIDTFDCVIPTREARHGRLYTDAGTIDVRKSKHSTDRRKLYGSRATIGKLQHLFRASDMQAGRLATLHNIMWFNTLLKRIRTALADPASTRLGEAGGSYQRLKKQTLRAFTRSNRTS